MASRQRSIVHPEHFVVAPGVLGLPLASPSRRAYAMGIDLLLAAILVKAGGLLLAFAAAAILFRAAAPNERSGFIRRSVRMGLRLGGAILLFFVIAKGWSAIRHRIEAREEKAAAVESSGDLNLKLTPRQLTGLARPLMTLRKAEDSVEVAKAAKQVLETAKAAGTSNRDLNDAREGFIALLGDHPDSAKIGALDAALQEVAPLQPKVVVPDSVVERYLAARAQHDSGATQIYRDSVKQLVAGDEIAELQSRANRADSLQKALEKVKQERGIRTALAGFAVDDLGVGFGWFAVYFTAFLALWRGQTPGKRVAGIRVVRLDGEPLGWWMSFERFGGYAASFSVGLLGFLQILWDKNRQGLHDKACETVVVRIK